MGHFISDKSNDTSSLSGAAPLRVLISSDTHRGQTEKTSKIHAAWAKELSLLEFDVLLLAGDLGASRKSHFKDALIFFKDLAGDRPVLFVRGNHDFHEASFNHHQNRWVIKQNSFRAMLQQQNEWFEEIGVHHLEKGPFETDKAFFVGWDGWYAQSEREMENLRNLCSMRFLHSKQYQSLALSAAFDKSFKALDSHRIQPSGLRKGRGWESRKLDTIYMPNDKAKIAPWIDGLRSCDWLRAHSEEAFERALCAAEQMRLKSPSKKIIATTHMPPYFDSDTDRIYNGRADQLERMSHTIDYLCHGHNHLFSDEFRCGVRILNAGSDYDRPNFILLEIM